MVFALVPACFAKPKFWVVFAWEAEKNGSSSPKKKKDHLTSKNPKFQIQNFERKFYKPYLNNGGVMGSGGALCRRRAQGRTSISFWTENFNGGEVEEERAKLRVTSSFSITTKNENNWIKENKKENFKRQKHVPIFSVVSKTNQ